MNGKYHHEKEMIADFMRRLYQKSLTTTSGGNISYRLDEQTILMTPSGLDKGSMKSQQIGMMSIHGENLTPGLRPTAEKNMHLAIYQSRSDVKAIIHAHPVISSAFAAMNRTINNRLIAESRVVLGEIKKAAYATQGTEKLAANVVEALTHTHIALMENHGVIAVGETMLQAFDRIEVLENAAKITLITDLLKDKKEISGEQLKILDSLLS